MEQPVQMTMAGGFKKCTIQHFRLGLGETRLVLPENSVPVSLTINQEGGVTVCFLVPTVDAAPPTDFVFGAYLTGEEVNTEENFYVGSVSVPGFDLPWHFFLVAKE